MGKWEDDAVQFPRLIAEINATQDRLDIDALAASMDLEPGNVHELFDRADAAWERIKGGPCECEDDPVPGAIWPMATNCDDSHQWVERCDACGRFASDDDAAVAVIAWLVAGNGPQVITVGSARPSGVSGFHPYIDPVDR